jgi:uncharacterized membrane protein YraQ (UPF0718 family)
MDIFAPFQLLADKITNDWLGIENQYLNGSLNFFIYDVLKIGLLLIVINFVMAVTRYYFPVKKIRKILLERKWYGANYLMAALLGAVTPFCSCSSIPLFIGFTSAGIPLGTTFAFLIASPLVNEASLLIFPSIFGLKMTLVYNIIGITIAMLAGMIIQRLKMDKHVNHEFFNFEAAKEAEQKNGGQKIALAARLKIWWKDGMRVTKSIYLYVLMGVALGALIHGFVPKDFVESYLAVGRFWDVPLAVLLGMPLYANSVSVIPVIEALTGKGIALGTSLAFMTSTVTLSIPSLLILKKAMDWKLLSVFIVVTSIGIMIIGYFFNWFAFVL